jgi:hypothetical protein
LRQSGKYKERVTETIESKSEPSAESTAAVAQTTEDSLPVEPSDETNEKESKKSQEGANAE